MSVIADTSSLPPCRSAHDEEAAGGHLFSSEPGLQEEASLLLAVLMIFLWEQGRAGSGPMRPCAVARDPY
jgi:hypothetical protein